MAGGIWIRGAVCVLVVFLLVVAALKPRKKRVHPIVPKRPASRKILLSILLLLPRKERSHA